MVLHSSASQRQGQYPGSKQKTRYLDAKNPADRPVLEHMDASIDELKVRHDSGEVNVANLDDFADHLRNDYDINVDIIDKKDSKTQAFRFNMIGDDRITTGKHLYSNIGKMHNIDGLAPLTGAVVQEKFGMQFARRSSLESQSQANSNEARPSRPPARRPAHQAAAESESELDESEDFGPADPDLVQPQSSAQSTQIAGGGVFDDGTDASSGDESDGAASEPAVSAEAGRQMGYRAFDAPIEDIQEDFGDPMEDQGSEKPPSQTSGRSDQAKPFTAQPSPQKPSEIVQPPPAPQSSAQSQDDRDRAMQAERKMSDAASTASGLASGGGADGSPDGVTLVGDSAEAMLLLSAAALAGSELVKQVIAGQDERQWRRLAEIGKQAEAVEKRGQAIGERIVAAEDTLAERRQPNQPEASAGDKAVEARLQAQTETIEDYDKRMERLGKPDPDSNQSKLEVPRIDRNASINKRLDALEKYLVKLNKRLDSIEDRLSSLEEEAGISQAQPESEQKLESGQPGNQQDSSGAGENSPGNAGGTSTRAPASRTQSGSGPGKRSNSKSKAKDFQM